MKLKLMNTFVMYQSTLVRHIRQMYGVKPLNESRSVIRKAP